MGEQLYLLAGLKSIAGKPGLHSGLPYFQCCQSRHFDSSLRCIARTAEGIRPYPLSMVDEADRIINQLQALRFPITAKVLY